MSSNLSRAVAVQSGLLEDIAEFLIGRPPRRRREFLDSDKGFTLSVGEVGYLRDACGLDASSWSRDREFLSTDPSIVM